MNLKDEANKLKNKLNHISNRIKKTEKELQEININIEFEMKVEDRMVLMWDNYEKENRFRLLLRENVMFHGPIIKPLIETSALIRFKIYKHLTLFIKEFSTFIQNINYSFSKDIHELLKEINNLSSLNPESNDYDDDISY